MAFVDEIDVAVDRFFKNHKVFAGYPNEVYKSNQKSLQVFVDGIRTSHDQLSTKIFLEYDKKVGFQRKVKGTQAKIKNLVTEKLHSQAK